jgi:hypothetical protein
MPEHADLVRLAEQSGIPVRQLWLEAVAAAGTPVTDERVIDEDEPAIDERAAPAPGPTAPVRR